MIYSFYSKPKINMTDTEQQVKNKLATHQGIIITKKVGNTFVPPENDKFQKKLPLIFVSDCNEQFIVDSTQMNNIGMVQELVREVNRCYDDFEIPKHSGGYRTIEAPMPKLKALQRNTANIITRTLKYLPSNNAHGFVKNRNCMTALKIHQDNGSRYFLKLDIHDFFGSITCKTLKNAMYNHASFLMVSAKVVDFVVIIATRNDKLPQGSPLSPVLANLVLHQFDFDLNNFLKNLNKDFVYTRYADDLLISSKSDFKADEYRIIQYIKQQLEKVGCRLSETKTRYGSCAGRNWNLGIMYNKDGNLTIGYRKKKYFKNMLHNFETGKIPQEKYYDALQTLTGQIVYAAYIEPEYMKPYLDRVRALSVTI